MNISMMKREETDSDDSDDLILPTPEAKSTPLFPNRVRQQSSSSDSSSNRGHLETPKLPVSVIRSAQDTDSSSDEDEYRSSSRPVQLNMKQEADDSSSEDEETLPSDTRGSQPSIQTTVRQAHTMSSSDDSDSDAQRTVTRNQTMKPHESSDDSDEEEPPRNETLRQNESSDSEEETEVQGKQSTNQDESSDESDENESASPIKHNSKPDESSDDSDEEESVPQNNHPPVQNNSSDESSDDEESAPASKMNFSGLPLKTEAPSTESSDGEEERQAPTQNLVPAQNETESSSEEEIPPHRQSSQMQTKNIQPDDSSESEEETSKQKPVPQNSRSSSESESDDEAPEQSKQPAQSGDTSSDDEEEETMPDTKPLLNTMNQNADNDDETSSEEEDEPNVKPSLLPSSTNLNASTDSSEAESEEDGSPPLSGNHKSSNKESSEEELMKKPITSSPFENLKVPQQNSTVNSLSFWKPLGDIVTHNSSLGTPGQIRKSILPTTLKGRGPELVKNCFEGRERMHVGNPNLAIEDIGSDDELWLFQCPNNMDVHALKKQHINLASSSDIQLEDGPTFKRFSVLPEKKKHLSINCVLPSRNNNKFQICQLPIKGKVVIEEHVHVPKLRLPEVAPKQPVPMPNGLKLRHPLLGVGFEEHLMQAKSVLHQNHNSLKKSKKKKRQISETANEIVHSPSLHQEIPQNQSSGKRRKNKHREPENLKHLNGDSSDKRNEISSSINQLNDSINNVLDGSILNDTYQKKHKKSKRSKSEENVSNAVPSWHTPVNESPASVLDSSEKKKKKKKSVEGEILSPLEIKQERIEPQVQGKLSETFSEDMFSKKRKRKEALNLNEVPTPAKKKKYSM